ncbi:uncharacterized protein LOC130901181 isoform X2 [Diorhabda carinulata]|uniref:uncharacterized protein LOC130901181 isoform X2 n=1 Tax=Diorhabda carinulata TaxID=1163345 RepID=UPI0025A1E8DC|nr:uncharacterized protein LOC130901181 isoform X2 [Diorhabda carinulata]
MKANILLNIILVQLVVVYAILQNVRGQTSSSLPEIIQYCYKSNFNVTARPPLTLHLLIELIRKIEVNERNAINMRLLASSILHGVMFNGIRQTKTTNTEGDKLVIPFRATGEEFYKYRLITDYLIPGQIEHFPRESLSLSELCFLHTLISSSVDPIERGDENLTCDDRSSMSLEIKDTYVQSRCVLRRGVLKTKWGPVSATQLLSGIAAGLQNNLATFGRVKSGIQKKNGIISSDGTFTSEKGINIIWVATMASDLAQAILNQTTGMAIIGNKGFWNDTMLPKAYYLKTGYWDMIDADILAGIDGAILGTNVEGWLNILESIRLSQILDMYYSERFVMYQFGNKANNRTLTFDSLIRGINLTDQIIGSAKLLQTIGSYPAGITDQGIREMAEILSVRFKYIAENLANEYDRIEYINGKQMKASLELIIILDGTFEYYKALQMIYALSEAIQVSYYGSRIGIVSGQSGNWLVNVTREVFQLFTDLNELRDEWPVTLSLGRSLGTVISYYQNRSRNNCNQKGIKPEGQVLFVFSKDGRLTDNDVEISKQCINTLKSSDPGTRIIYITQEEENSLVQLVRDNDFLMKISNDVVSTVQQLSDYLSGIPASIIRLYCNNILFEDYVTPQSENIYEINREYIKRNYIHIKFMNSNYGELVVCAYQSNTTNDRVCKGITVNGEISFNSKDFCTPDLPCDVHFAVTANSSQIICAEYDCRYPDQIRMDIKCTYTATTGSLASNSLLLINLMNLLVLIS